MAFFNPYTQYQSSYQQAYQQPAYQQPTYQQPQASNRWEWVQGEMGAKSYLVAPNTTVLLLDSENKRFYLKSADASGMPMPLRSFEYTEVVQATTPELAPVAEKHEEYATKSDLDALAKKLEKLTKKEAAKDE